MEKSSEIKLRLLEVSKNKGISYEKFFKDFGSTYANFKGKSLKSSLRSEVLADFSAKHPDIDLNWVITGKGNPAEENILQEPGSGYSLSNEIDFLKRLIKTKEEIIAAKEETIEVLKNQLGVKNECQNKAV